MKFLITQLFFIFSLQIFACNLPIATTTNYYTPVALKQCSRWYYGKAPKPKKTKYDKQEYVATEKVCSKFAADVKLQGSGRYNRTAQ